MFSTKQLLIMSRSSQTILPPEIILRIFSLLKFNELVTSSLVCTQWYNVSQHKSMVKRYLIYVNSEQQMESLLNSNRFFSNLVFGFHPNENQLSLFHKFWETFLNNIEYICLDGIQDTNLIFKTLLRSQSLQTLEFRRLNYLFNLGDQDSKSTITRVSFGDHIFDDLQIPMKILSIIPKLESLQLKTKKMESSFLQYLTNPEFTSTLRSLNLFFDVQHFSISYVRNFFIEFSQAKHFDLENFSFSFKTLVFTQDDHRQIVDFFLTQKNLQSLKMFTCGEIVIFDQLVSALPKLKNIGMEIQNEFDPLMINSKQFLVENFKKFWNLESFEIHYQDFYQYTNPIFDSLTGPSHLGKLVIVRSDFPTNIELTTRMQFLTLLTHLTITESFITDRLLQSIFEHLLNLRYLRLISRGEDNVTDSGITGEQNGFSICRLARLEQVVISLNGKSEISDLSLEHFSRLYYLQILWLSLRVQLSDDQKSSFKSTSRAKLYFPGCDHCRLTRPNWVDKWLKSHTIFRYRSMAKQSYLKQAFKDNICLNFKPTEVVKNY